MVLDKVPALAVGSSQPFLAELNAVMRRIDLICKLISPVFISAIVLWVSSVRATILILAGMNCASIGIEWFAARRVWMGCERLQSPKAIDTEQGSSGESGDIRKINRWGQSMKLFFRSKIWIREYLLF